MTSSRNTNARNQCPHWRSFLWVSGCPVMGKGHPWLFNSMSHFLSPPCWGHGCSSISPTQQGDTPKSGRHPGQHPSPWPVTWLSSVRIWSQDGVSAWPSWRTGMSPIISSAAFHITELSRSVLSRARARMKGQCIKTERNCQPLRSWH